MREPTVILAALEDAIVTSALARPDAARLIEPLTKLRIVFAHQSVGADILGGVAAIAEAAGAALNIVETRTPSDAAGVYHYKVGRNRAPDEKLSDFEQTMAKCEPGLLDVALVKLCYVDIEDNADAKALAERYLTTLGRVRERGPRTRVIAVTCPLTTVQSGPKAWIKRLLGRAPRGYLANARRRAFNDIIRERTATSELFDLADAEADYENRITQFVYAGAQIPALTPGLTHDGGHLNERGRVHAARRLLELLSRPAA